jgi:hypothetical protein
MTVLYIRRFYRNQDVLNERELSKLDTQFRLYLGLDFKFPPMDLR